VKNRLVLTASAALVALALTVTACSSSSNTSTPTTTASSGSGATDKACTAFSGTLGQSSGGSSTVSGATVTGITTSKQGCVDNIQITMAKGVTSWTAAYADGTFTDANGSTISTGQPAQLIITIQGAAWTGAAKPPSTVLPVNLDYVKTINIANGANGSTIIVLGFPTKKPYQASDSQNPAYISLGIG
jgi:hypothetical protein